jgi:16S rRNA pseudouridine516 synthase
MRSCCRDYSWANADWPEACGLIRGPKMPQSPPMPRLDQLLASLGYGSRREVRGWIEAGRVTVGGVPAADPGARVEPGRSGSTARRWTIPASSCSCSTSRRVGCAPTIPAEGPSVYGLLPERWQRRNPPVTSVGRLDKETTGLLLLTD